VLVTPDQSVALMLLTIVGARPSEAAVLRLFANDWQPTRRDTAETYLEASGGGYAPRLIAEDEWVVQDGVLTTADRKVFVFSGPAGPFYGYYLTQALSGRLLWAERFPGIDLPPARPPAPRHAGDEIVVTPSWSLRKGVL